FGAPPPLRLFGGSNSLGVRAENSDAKTHRENEIAYLSAPALAGEGARAKRGGGGGGREEGGGGGPQDSTLRYRCRKFSEQELGACVNDRALPLRPRP